MAEEFKGKTPEEIAALQVFPEPDQTDGGSIAQDGRGYVYFITEHGNTGYFKVGQTINPSKRRINLQTGNPRMLNMDLHVVSDMDAVEGRLLEAMAERYPKTSGGKEWFKGDVEEAYKLFLSIAP